MAKVLKVAASVVGAIATVASFIPGPWQPFAAVVAKGAFALAAAISVVEVLTARKPSISVSGDQTKFTINKDQGIPWAIGRTAVAGFLVHQQTFDTGGSKDNAYLTRFAVLSGDTCYAIEGFQVDKVATDFSGDGAIGAFAGYMWRNTQLGACPEAAALAAASFYSYPAGWDSTSKLSGNAAFSITLKFDTAGKKYPSGIPELTTILKGALAWDPRKDDSYPGGSGAHRPDDPSTWEYTENAWLLGLRWARGIYQNGKRVMGIGFALASIDVPAFVEAANIFDANGWTCGGVVYSTDGKWDVLRKICAAGSGEPIQLGGMLSCRFDAPRVSLATITTPDLMGAASVTATPMIKDRVNGVIPSYRSETHGWAIVPAKPVQVADYVTADGRPKTKGVTWELVQDVHQVAQLATYEICNAREFGPIITPLKLRWIGYKPGDCLTIDSSELGMDAQPVIIQRRRIDPGTGGVTLTMRSETPGKHAFALGKTGTPPPTPSLQTTDRAALLIPGVSANWTGVNDNDPLNHPRPEDGATVGAPSGTNVAGVPATQLVIDLNQAKTDALSQLAAIMSSQQLAEFRAAENDILTHYDGKTMEVIVRQEIQNRTTATTALYQIVNTIGVLSPDGSAFTIDGTKVFIDADHSLSEKFTEISASFGTIGSQITAANAAFTSFQSAQAASNTATASSITTLTASIGSTAATVSAFQTAQATANSAYAASITSLTATVGDHSGSITDLQDVLINPDGDVVAKGVWAFDADGNIAGIYSTVTKETSSISLRFGVYDFQTPTGGSIFHAEGDEVHMPNVIVERLKDNTAVVPVRASSTSAITGSWSSGSIVGDTDTVVHLSVDIVMTRPGWIEINANFKQNFSSGDRLWGAALDVDSTILPESYIYGGAVQDAIPLAGSFYAEAAGTYTVNLRWQAHSSVELRGRSMFVKGYPFT